MGCNPAKDHQLPTPAVGCSSGILSHKFQPWPVISPQVMVMGKDAPGRGNSSEHAFPSLGLKSQTSDEPSLLPNSSHRQHLLPAAKMRRRASAPQPRGEIMAKDPSPAKDLQVWAAISGPRASPVTGYTCHDKAVPPAMGEALLGTCRDSAWAHRCVIIRGGCRLHPPCFVPLGGFHPQKDTLWSRPAGPLLASSEQGWPVSEGDRAPHLQLRLRG